jgi:hypothetical protein
MANSNSCCEICTLPSRNIENVSLSIDETTLFSLIKIKNIIPHFPFSFLVCQKLQFRAYYVGWHYTSHKKMVFQETNAAFHSNKPTQQ